MAGKMRQQGSARGRSEGSSRSRRGDRRDQRDRTAPRGQRDRSRRDGARDARPVSKRASAGLAANLIEGRRAAAEALRTGFPVKCALIAQGDDDRALAGLVGDLGRAGVPIKRVPRDELDSVSSHGAHQGIVLECGAFPYASIEDIVARAGEGAALVVVLDHVTDAGNFGAIVRSAEVAGAAGVVIASKRAAEVNVGAFKTSAGAVMHLPIAQVPNIARALEDLKSAGFWAVGASEHATDSCWSTSLTGRIALVMGSEGDGISPLVLKTCDMLIKLPQLGQTESLNVAQAATALSYEWLRQNAAELGLGPSAAPTGAAGEAM